jgi:hypothetical protein
MNFLLATVLMIFSITTFGQSAILNESFESNNNKWVINRSGDNQFTFNEGKYLASGKSDETRLSAIPVRVKNKEDFSVSITAEHLNGANNYAYGIYLGDKYGSNSYAFVISAISQYKFYGYENGIYKELLGWTKHTAIKKGNAANILTISKKGSSLRLNINGRLVVEVPARIVLDDIYIGVTRSNKQTVAFDDLRVSE